MSQEPMLVARVRKLVSVQYFLCLVHPSPSDAQIATTLSRNDSGRDKVLSLAKTSQSNPETENNHESNTV